MFEHSNLFLTEIMPFLHYEDQPADAAHRSKSLCTLRIIENTSHLCRWKFNVLNVKGAVHSITAYVKYENISHAMKTIVFKWQFCCFRRKHFYSMYTVRPHKGKLINSLYWKYSWLLSSFLRLPMSERRRDPFLTSRKKSISVLDLWKSSSQKGTWKVLIL
jgi:hypothetical protein